MTHFLFNFSIGCAFCISFVFCVYVKDEEPSTKPPLQVEKLPWLAFFDRGKSSDNFERRDQGQTQRRASDFTSHFSLCPSGETGQFPYPPDCKRFINCWKGRGSVQVCAPGTLFNSETFECDFPGKVKCEDGFGGFGDQLPMPTRERYVRFPHQRPEVAQNPRIARKNEEQQSKPDSIPAKPYPGRPPYFGPSHLNPPTRPTNQSDGREVRPQCPLGMTGLYPHPYDCTKFLKCWSGNTFIQNCGPGTFFNPLISACDHPSNVPCAHEENHQPAQPIQPEAEIEIEDLQIPEESVQHEQYQDVNLGLKPVKEVIGTTKDHQSPNYEDDEAVTTPKDKIDNFQEPETETSHRKPKIINIGGRPKDNQIEKVEKEPAPYLTPPQYDVYGNHIKSGSKNQALGVQPSQASRQEIPNSGYTSNPYLFTYPPHGPYSDQQKLGLEGTKTYYGYALNKKHPNHPYQMHHPHHPHHSHHPHHPHLSLHMGPPTWLVPPPFQNQFFPHYAPNHPFLPQSQTSTSHNLPQMPYYPYSVPIMCATSQHEPSAPKCEPGIPLYEPEKPSSQPTQNGIVNQQHQAYPMVPKPILTPDKQYPTHYGPHLQIDFNQNVQSPNPQTPATENKNTKPQSQFDQSSVFGSSYNFKPPYGEVNNENPQVQIPPTLPAGNQFGSGSDFTPHQYPNSQFQPKPQTVQHKPADAQNQFPYYPSRYAPQLDNQNLKPQSVDPSNSQSVSTQSPHSQLPSASQTNQKPIHPQSQPPYYPSGYASQNPKQEIPEIPQHTTNKNSPSTPQYPIYYYPMYPVYPASYFSQTPPNTPTQVQSGSAPVDKNIDYLYKPSKPVYGPILPNQPQQSSTIGPFDNKNDVDKDNESQPSKNYPVYHPTNTNEEKQTLAENSTPASVKTKKPHSGYIKSEPPKQYLIENIDVRTGSESSEDLAERITTTQSPPKRKGTEKVDEFFVNTKKPLYTLPDKYSQSEETTKEATQPQNNFNHPEEKPKKKPYVKVKQTPPNGQQVRLRNGASHLDGYLEMKDSKSKWGLVCDRAGEWGVAEATVACRELGFLRGAELSWQGYPIKSDSEDLQVAVNGINCTGTEATLSECQVKHSDEGQCDIGRNAVGVRCFDNLASHCQPKEILYNQHCYKLHEKENPDDPWIKTDEASEQCKKFGGKLVDITSQYENDFLSEWLIKKHPDVTAVLTGGIGISVLGRPMWLWEGTNDPMVYERWWSGWSGDQNIPKGSIDGPLCIVLRKTFSCSDGEGQNQETITDEETCSADYFFWDVEDCGKLRTSVFICERPMDDIGCVVGNGESYTGTANTTASGLPCLPWDHPKVVEGLARRRQAQERSSRLVGHNYCRNLGNPDRHPWCFVEGRGNSEYCAIPQCWDSVSGSYSRSSGQWSSCDANHFECKPGECVKKEWICDGQRDCSNGKDEDACKVFVQEFSRELNRKMNGKGNEKWPNVNENTCAKLCLENKNFKCKSFSYHTKNKDCLLSDSNIGLSGQVVYSRGWTYHERSSDSLRCSLDNGFFGCRNGKCINISNVCDGKKNCEDGSDERDCERLGYQIRLTGSPEKHKGRIEVKILGKWGVVCDDMFDLRDAEVVCRELGFRLGAAEVFKHSEFPVENPLFLVDHLDCRGNETSIRECSFPGWGKHNCGPEEVAGVACRVPGVECPEGQWQCKRSKECISLAYLCDELKDCDDGTDEDKPMCGSPIQIRLSGGPNATSGRLEIRRFDIWGTVCHDDFSAEAGHSVCSLLGFNGPSLVKKAAYFGEGKGPIWLDSGLCFVNETNLEECSKHMGFQNNCKHDEDVSLICSQHHQKSSALRPIAASSADDDNKNEEKLKLILISECSGKPKHRVSHHKYEKVVGGNDVAREVLPWQASVRVRSGSGKSVHWCGAIIISPYHVLTAGHCLRDYNKAAYFIRVGDYDTKVPDPHEREFGIEHLYIHPEFSKNVNLNNDIGLIKIKGEIPFGEYIKPACLAPSTHIYTPGTNCSVSGWGSVSADSAGYARTLRRAFIPILEPSVCRAPFVYGESLSEGMFCAGHLDGGVDSCQGDSGGPLICQYEGREYLLGITSWGHGCGRANKPGVYTNVAFYADWIQQKIHASLS